MDKSKQDALIAELEPKLGDALRSTDRSYGDLVLIVDKSEVHELLAFLRNMKKFDLLLDIAGVDLSAMDEYDERFELEYMLYATSTHDRVRVRVPVPETDLDVPTSTDLWQSANWAEREAFEMFGFNFVGHPCLKRLLTHHEFEGYPLRKDYPTMGGQWCSTTSVMTEELEERQGGAPK